MLFKRHASLCALLCVLLGAFAAPYLIPENPDSAVFRSGVLGLLLMAGCFFPARDAFARAGRRALLAGGAFGLLFALALSLGSELFVYDGLLPGTGSLVRRLAVPVLAAPLFGTLCTRLLLAPPLRGVSPARIPHGAYTAVLLVCWLPLLLAYFPGMLNYDFLSEYNQHLVTGYSSVHPLLHSALVTAVVTLGEVLHSRTFGVLLLSLLQMALFASALAHACVFAQRKGAPRPALALLTALFAFHPVFSVMALSMTKDTLFAAGVLVLSLDAWDALSAPAAFFADKRRLLRFVLCAVCTALMRNNGVFVLALLLPGLLAALPGYRRRMARLAAVCVGASALVLLALNLALSPSPMPSFQLYSLPAQQLVRAYNSGKLSEADRAEIASWYTSDAGLAVHPHLGDSAKGYLDKPRIAAEGSDFLALWARVGKTCSHEYLEALLMLNVGSWYPDDLSHATIYPDVSYNDKGYLQTQEYDMTEQGIDTFCFLPGVRRWVERVCRRNEYQRYPIIAQLFCTATPFWLMLFVCALLVARRQTRLLPATLGVLGLWLSYLFGPCTLPRYALPLFALSPVLLLAALLLPRAAAPHEHPDASCDKTAGLNA